MRKNRTPWWVYLVGFVVVSTGLFNLVKYGRYQPGVYHEPSRSGQPLTDEEMQRLLDMSEGNYGSHDDLWNNSYYEN